ncbi:facilitated trehalose transporter Tret1 isoform X2 [Nilaparvata lugens]|uniref:Sugar transporter 6 n=1 Tax=Nilaparvata lugens TaxID=108931 RepID=D4AHX1_NILLU|nr:facilitated trehalose transporter Tret1 isoform X1 [Nilaparvata lugens]XP_022188573.1 facilitated trehalose transporter Tret1 isoform X1 [Nilaparvata lugens]XP_039295767.1 facilitated trehalose transporter Tret1 isoform X2 [Nilaparvata lugens]XP_039295775.1 facilitated trehalose transporter Tret1 isoform X2 [Nilaparvata lugens]BAI83420.1 sugar transporter 6 [Nilaparvata lugens]
MASKGDHNSEAALPVHPLLGGDRPRGGARPTMESGKTSNRNLYIACCICNLASFAAGNALTWSSPTISKMKENNEIHISQESWLGSLIALGASLGPFVSGFLIDRIGRKKTLYLNAVLIILSWILIGIAISSFDSISFELIYVGRVLAGVSAGSCYASIPMYIGEIAEDSVRGAVGSLLAFFLCGGFLLEYVVGPYVSYLVLILVSCIAPIAFLVLFFFMPESPYYLIAQGRNAEAIRALQWLRGADDASIVQKEVTDMQNSVNESATQKSGAIELVKSKGNFKALYLSCGLVAFQQFSGINVILFYSEQIFHLTGAALSPAICSIIIGAVLVISGGIAPPVTSIFGIKMMLIVSGVGMFLSEALLGVYFFFKDKGVDVSSLSTAPIIFMVVYIVTYCLGFGPLPWAVMGEMFPPNMKAKASAITASFCWILGFIITLGFNSVAASLGMAFAFWIFSGFCVVAILFTVVLLPDTRGLSLQEIQDVLNGRPVNRKL